MKITGRALLKNAPITPKKMELILFSLGEKDPIEVRNVLMIDKRKASKILLKVLNSALANVSSKGVNLKLGVLKFKTLKVDEGLKIKRWRAGSRGTPQMFVRRRSHILIEVETIENNFKDKKVKSEKKKN